MKYLFIGHGRVAGHLGHYLLSEGHKVSIWSRRDTKPLAELASKAQVLCLSTRDHEIESVIKAYDLKQYGKPLVHFSGSQSVDGCWGFHPLMSFGPELYSKETYRSIHFVGATSQRFFRQSFPKFKNPYHEIDAEKLALYHAFCSMAGNFPQILWDELSVRFEQDLGLERESLKPFIGQVAQNYLKHGERALTGPLVRNDHKTLIRHLDALTGHNLQNLYYSFINLFQKKKKSSEISNEFNRI